MWLFGPIIMVKLSQTTTRLVTKTIPGTFLISCEFTMASQKHRWSHSYSWIQCIHYLYVCKYIHTYIYIYSITHTYIYDISYMYIYVCIYIYTHTCIYLYIHRYYILYTQYIYIYNMYIYIYLYWYIDMTSP